VAWKFLGHPFKEDNARYFLFYNGERLHTSLGDRTPYEVYFKQPMPLNPERGPLEDETLIMDITI